MEDGLFFWLVIMAVAVLQGIGARKKKAGQQGKKMPQAPPRPRQGLPQGFPPGQERAPRPTRPARASFPPEEEIGELGSEKDGSSEGMIPSDVWAEILGLARGEAQRAEPEVEVTPEPDPVPTRVSTRDHTPAPRPFPTSHGADATLHETKPDQYESRLAIASPTAPLSGSGGHGGAREELFGSGSPRELRKAVILQEVLGPPLSLKEE